MSDSYDIYNACAGLWGDKLRDQVLARDGCLVIRPDSGDPTEVVPKVLEILGGRFGFTRNAKGFKVLDPHVRMIQGDGIDLQMLGKLIAAVEDHGWSLDNIAFGSGGGLLQKVKRDTQKCAIKCSAVMIGETWHDVLKDPITDPGKKSKAGRLALVKGDAGFMTLRSDTRVAGVAASERSLLVPVFRDGEVLVTYTLDAVRKRALEG